MERSAGLGSLSPGRVLRVPGIPVAIAALFTVMTIFSGFFFTLALHLEDGLGYSPLRAGLTFAPAAATFALVSLNPPALVIVNGYCPWEGSNRSRSLTSPPCCPNCPSFRVRGAAHRMVSRSLPRSLAAQVARVHSGLRKE